MSGTVIRDVVIKLRIDQAEAKLKVPDVKSAVSAIKAVEKAGKQSARASLKETERIDKARIAQERKTAKIIQKIRKEQYQARLKEEKRLEKEREKAARIQAGAGAKIAEQNTKAAEGFRTMGDGAFTAARGLTLLFTSTDKDLKKLVENLAIAQGAFDLFRGGIDVVKGLREGIIALNTASKVAAEANTAVAASNTAVAASSTAAAGGTTALTAAITPLGIGLLALGAAYAAYLMWQKKSNAEKAKEIKKFRDIRNQVAELNSTQQAAWSREAARKRDEIRVRRDDLRSLNKVQKARLKIATDRKNEADLARQRSEGKRILTGRTEGQWQAGQALTPNPAVFGKNAKPFASRDDYLERSGARAEALVRRGVVGQKNSPIGKQGLDEAKRNTVFLRDRSKELQDLALRRIDSAKRLVDAQKEQLRTTQENLRATRQTLAAEQQRVESVEASIHRLDPEKKARLKAISAKAGRGESLTNRELEFARQNAGSSKVVTDFVRREEAKRGRGDAQQIVGGFNPNQLPAGQAGPTSGVLRGPGSQLEGLQARERQQAELSAKQVSALRELQIKTAKNKERELNIVEGLVKDQEKLDARLTVIESGRIQAGAED